MSPPRSEGEAGRDCSAFPAGVELPSGSLARWSRNHTSLVSSDLSHQLRAPRALASAAFPALPGRRPARAEGDDGCAQPGSRLSRTGRALDGCQRGAARPFPSSPWRQTSSRQQRPIGHPWQDSRPRAVALGRAEDGPSVSASPGRPLGPSCSVPCRRQIHLNTDTANLSQAICALTACRKRDLSLPMTMCAQEPWEQLELLGSFPTQWAKPVTAGRSLLPRDAGPFALRVSPLPRCSTPRSPAHRPGPSCSCFWPHRAAAGKRQVLESVGLFAQYWVTAHAPPLSTLFHCKV